MAGDVIRGPWPGSGEQRPAGSENHPAGRKRARSVAPGARQRDIEFRWRSEFPSTTEERRATVLAGKPRCLDCDRPFNTRQRPPADLICRDCRETREHVAAESQEPPLF
ncbi:hypothetical protein [Gordonia westfalica]|uniref:Uncharacterized protein n=1 Tax=Gordonia westfalica TaxID=158898 RepID=A0A1H2J2C8_9ACTN|nr:hypothetical protein [Gordonia westfalica]SDU50604.1 hypothetical protein SAMN04488548_1341665 [Gordonia westfalica]